MLFGSVPFKAGSMSELHELILRGKYQLKEEISIEAQDLIKGMLDRNPQK